MIIESVINPVFISYDDSEGDANIRAAWRGESARSEGGITILARAMGRYTNVGLVRLGGYDAVGETWAVVVDYSRSAAPVVYTMANREDAAIQFMRQADIAGVASV